MEFYYKAKDIRTGKKVSSIITAENPAAVIMSLQAQGLMPFKISESKGVNFRIDWQKTLKRPVGKIRSKEICIFTRQLAAILGAGLLLSEALESVANDMENYNFQSVIYQVQKDITSGVSFSQALKRHKTIFSQYFISVVKSGEATGKLHATLDSLALFLENIERIKQKVSSAIQYPMFIFIFACIVIISLVIFIIPKFKDIFEQSGAQLPFITQAVISFSDQVINHWMGIVGFLVVLAVMMRFILRLPQVMPYVDAFKLKIPLIGPHIIHKSLVSQFCRTLGFMLSAGVSLPATLEISAQVIQNSPMVEAINIIRQKILGGVPLSNAIREQKLFPQLVSKMTSVGEKTGRMDRMLTRTAEYYDNELENSIHGLLVMIEPALIIFVGIIIGIVVVSLYLPIFKLSTLIQ